MPTDIVGTAADDNFLRYTLLMNAGRRPSFTRLVGSGTTPVVSGVLGRLDPTLLRERHVSRAARRRGRQRPARRSTSVSYRVSG